jgi:EAL domain-containing protein (putative c-di-GMP-specific phosphodiesterase class I)
MSLTRPDSEREFVTAQVSTRPPGPLASDLCRGIDAGELFVVYQSIVRNVAGETRGAEALLRWSHSECGLLFPSDFYDALLDPIASEKVGHFVLNRVCRDLGQLPVEQRADSYVTINAPLCILLNTALPDLIEQLCNRYGVSPSALMLEILESENLVTIATLNEFIAPIRRLGVRFALDDFGTGYSSLARLASLQIDAVNSRAT